MKGKVSIVLGVFMEDCSDRMKFEQSPEGIEQEREPHGHLGQEHSLQTEQ